MRVVAVFLLPVTHLKQGQGAVNARWHWFVPQDVTVDLRDHRVALVHPARVVHPGAVSTSKQPKCPDQCRIQDFPEGRTANSKSGCDNLLYCKFLSKTA